MRFGKQQQAWTIRRLVYLALGVLAYGLLMLPTLLRMVDPLQSLLVIDNLQWSTTSTMREALTTRLAYYRNRYRYLPPTVHATAVNSDNSRETLCGTKPDYAIWFNLTLKNRSRSDEDKIIYETFFKDDMSQGTFVEIGAYDGSQESNTHFFDVCLGWSGLHVEGNPIMWNQLAQNRPHAHRMSFIPSCSLEEQESNKTIPFHPIGATNTGVQIPERGVKLVYNHRTDFVQVPCGSLTQVFQDIFPQGRISFWSLDVEGSEHLILEKMDFSQVYVEVIMVEVHNGFCRVHKPCEARDRSREILRNNGYIRFPKRVDHSDVFIHPQSTNLLEQAKKAGWEPANDA